MRQAAWGPVRQWPPAGRAPGNGWRRADRRHCWSIGFRSRETVQEVRVGGSATGLRDERLARLEGVLFVCGEALSARKLAALADLADGTEARTLIGQLNRRYDAVGSAFRVEEVAGGYRLLTRAEFGGWLRQLFQTPMHPRLSAPALETLAVVAYRQPIGRAGIEAIRGVQCGEILRQLLDRDFVRILGRSKEIGRPFLYGTTRRFLEVFGLRSLEELPRAAELRAEPRAAMHPTMAQGRVLSLSDQADREEEQ